MNSVSVTAIRVQTKILGATLLIAATVFGYAPVSAAPAVSRPASDTERLVLAICREDSSLSAWVSRDQLRLESRLGITYDGVVNKSLIAHGLPDQVKTGIIAGTIQYETAIDPLEDNYRLLTLKCTQPEYEQQFYLRDGKLILPSSYHIRNWPRFVTEHFEFIVADSSLLNEFSTARLEEFFSEMATKLDFTEQELQTFEHNKIQYLLCRDPEQVREVTGYESRGMYELASDRIVTCFKCHYHELVHLLINFKLRRLPLFTHPLLQEGIAVAWGGRGGKEPHVLAELGTFLVRSGMAEIEEVLSYDGFNGTHPSISYPISGVFCNYLIQQEGLDQFLALYRDYSGSQDRVASMDLNDRFRELNDSWSQFVSSSVADYAITLPAESDGLKEIYRSDDLSCSSNTDCYLINCSDTVFLGARPELSELEGDRITTLFGQRRYNGEKYAIIAGPQEIQLYNLYTDNLIANLVCAFRAETDQIAAVDGRYSFQIKKAILPDLPAILAEMTR